LIQQLPTRHQEGGQGEKADDRELTKLKLTKEDYNWMLCLAEKARRIADKIKELDEEAQLA
jgi:hypothetical protein